MNDLGMSLAWTAVQVSLVLIPATVLHAIAARRGPASGAWAATATLAVVVGLTLWAAIPLRRVSYPVRIERSLAVTEPADQTLAPIQKDRISPASRPGWRLEDLRRIWSRFESAAAAPMNPTRPWGSALAALGLGGTAIGLIRLMLGLASVRLCRSRSLALDDTSLIALRDELREAMGIDQEIEMRQTSDLNAPATAGWRRPVILLPADWRTWDRDELRAVLAHELAHVARRDYPAGLVARLALALHFYHPLVHWFSSRLFLEQELAADALGSRFAGGTALYLQSLSRMALRLDGKTPSLPARAFLPTKRTLIRRITMLNHETVCVETPWTTVRKTLAIGLLLAVAAGAVSLQGPARGAGEPLTLRTAAQPAVQPFDLSYLGNDATWVVALRPAELYRKAGTGAGGAVLRKALAELYRLALAESSVVAVDKANDAIRIENIEQICARFDIHHVEGHKEYSRTVSSTAVMVRTAEPFDWLNQYRAWGVTLEEARERKGVYYKPKRGTRFARTAIYLPDDRTLVIDVESQIVNLIQGHSAGAPAIAKTEAWERVSRDLLAVAFDNRKGDWTKIVQGSEEEATVLPFVEKVETWVASLANQDDLAMQATADCSGPEPAAALARKIEAVLQPIRLFAASKSSEPNTPASKLGVEMLAKTEVRQSSRNVSVGLTNFGTIADFIARILRENPL